jgi:hypothetical protein
MFKNMLFYLKYPSVAGVIGAIWIGSGFLIFSDRQLPTMTMVEINIAVSLLMAVVGFRVDKK